MKIGSSNTYVFLPRNDIYGNIRFKKFIVEI